MRGTFWSILLFAALLGLGACGGSWASGPETPASNPNEGGGVQASTAAEPRGQGAGSSPSPVAPVGRELLTPLAPSTNDVLIAGDLVFDGGDDGLTGALYDGLEPRGQRLREVLPGGVMGLCLVRPGLLAVGSGGEGIFLLDVRPGPAEQGASGDAPGRRLGHLSLGAAVWRLAPLGPLTLAAVGHQGLAVLDLSDPAHPRVIGRLPTEQGYVRQARPLGEDRVLLAEGWAGLALVDLSDPARPRLVDRLDTEGEARAVDAQGEVAFVADFRGGVVAVDLSDPTALRQISRLETPAAVRDVALIDDVLFVGLAGAGMLLVRVGDPSSMEVIGRDEVISAIRFHRQGDRLAVALAAGFSEVLDVSDPAAPRRRASLNRRPPR